MVMAIGRGCGRVRLEDAPVLAQQQHGVAHPFRHQHEALQRCLDLALGGDIGDDLQDGARAGIAAEDQARDHRDRAPSRVRWRRSPVHSHTRSSVASISVCGAGKTVCSSS